MADACPFSLTIPSELRLLPVARLFVEAVCQSAGLDPAAVNAVVLAVNAMIFLQAFYGQSEMPGKIEWSVIQATVNGSVLSIDTRW